MNWIKINKSYIKKYDNKFSLLSIRQKSIRTLNIEYNETKKKIRDVKKDKIITDVIFQPTDYGTTINNLLKFNL